jgi:hypothetical protein
MPEISCPGCARTIALTPAELSEQIVCSRCQTLFRPHRPDDALPGKTPQSITPVEAPSNPTVSSLPPSPVGMRRRQVAPWLVALLLLVGAGVIWFAIPSAPQQPEVNKSDATVVKVEPPPLQAIPLIMEVPPPKAEADPVKPEKPAFTVKEPPPIPKGAPLPKPPIKPKAQSAPAARPNPPPAPALAPGEWAEFTSAEGRFRVRLPGQPVAVGPPAGQVRSARVVGGLAFFTPDREYYALAGELDEPIPYPGRIDYLPAVMRDALREDYNGPLKAQKDILHDGHVGKDFIIVIPGRVRAQVRVFFAGTRYYVLGIGGAKEAPPAEEFARLIGSFRLGN